MAWRRPSRSISAACRRAAILAFLLGGAALLHRVLPGKPTWSVAQTQSRVKKMRHLSAEGSATNLTASASLGEPGQCQNLCFEALGFYPSDCVCHSQGSWYMWICSKYQGSPIQTQFCESHSCGGCHAPAGAPSAPPAPASTPAAPATAPKTTPQPFVPSPSAPPASTSAAPAMTPSPTLSTAQVAGYHPADERLLQASTAEKKTFYMYRVTNNQEYAPENQNMANLAGAMWYLHNEIVNHKGYRRFGKTRIQRFKVTTKATQPLIDDGMDFGVRVAFDLGRCTGPWQCADAFERYGYFVGCNYVNQFPTAQWKGQVFYPNATWYSLPGRCSSKHYNEHTVECDLSEPGGACDNATGAGNCTYSYESAGEISIDELEGIANFHDFAQTGGWEYDNKTDRGVLMTFWNDKSNATACEDRLDRARDLFKQKYDDSEELVEPACDFNFGAFYAHVPRRSS